MKKKGKLALRIIALLAAAALIGLILFVANAFVGNPISSYMAGKAMDKYVKEHYSDLNLEIGEVKYNFKFSEYWALAQSRTSMDTHFNIYYRNGKITWDDYEGSVLGKFNTLTRWEDEYSDYIKPVLSKIDGLEEHTSYVQIEKWEYEKANDNIRLDMKFDKQLPIDMSMTIRADLESDSLAEIAELLKQAHAALLAEKCVFVSYGLFSEANGTLIMIHSVTPADIESGKLEELLQAAREAKEEDAGKTADKESAQPDVQSKLSVYIKKS